MAQTTWPDSETRRTFLESLSALTDDKPGRRRSLLIAATIAAGVALAIFGL